MDELQALEISLLLWKDLSENLITKQESKFYYLVRNSDWKCSLCDVHIHLNDPNKGSCFNCCLNKPKLCDGGAGEAWENWKLNKGTNKGCDNAKLILHDLEQEYQKLTNQIPNYQELESKYPT